MNEITPQGSWIISARVHFTKKTNLFSGKIIKKFNGYPMKAVVIDVHWVFTTKYVHNKDSIGIVGRYIKGLEYDLLR